MSLEDEKLYSELFSVSYLGVPTKDFCSEEEFELEEELSSELESLSDWLDCEELEFDLD